MERGQRGAKAKVLLDGQPMEGKRELWAISRPSVGPAGIWMPAVKTSGLSSRSWKRTGRSPVCLIQRPMARGSISASRGVQRARMATAGAQSDLYRVPQRAIIEPADWRIAWTLGYRRLRCPKDFR